MSSSPVASAPPGSDLWIAHLLLRSPLTEATAQARGYPGTLDPTHPWWHERATWSARLSDRLGRIHRLLGDAVEDDEESGAKPRDQALLNALIDSFLYHEAMRAGLPRPAVTESLRDLARMIRVAPRHHARVPMPTSASLMTGTHATM